MLDSATMNDVRPHRSLIAWILYGLILFNSLVCSISHGQMLGVQFNASGGQFCAQQAHSADDMGAMSGRLSLGMKSMTPDCSFASSVTLAVIFFIALGWLMRRSRPSLIVPDSCRKKPPHYAFPKLNPQAP